MPRKPVAHHLKSTCPIAHALDIIGDKWTLLILRDMIFSNKHQYNEFLHSPEGVPTNVLSDRLKMLERHHLIEKKPYTSNRFEYHLTNRGMSISPVLKELIGWASDNFKNSNGEALTIAGALTVNEKARSFEAEFPPNPALNIMPIPDSKENSSLSENRNTPL